MIHFKTSKDDQTDRIVSALERLHVGKPVGSATIDKTRQMQHAQVLKYLHRANEAGQATPVLSGPDGIIRGWVPASAAPNESIAEKELTEADRDHRREQAALFQKQAESLRQQVKANDKAQAEAVKRRKQIENRMRQWQLSPWRPTVSPNVPGVRLFFDNLVECSERQSGNPAARG